MAKKAFSKVWRPTAAILPPVLVTGLCVVRDDHSQPLDQPHDHRENAPVEASPRTVMIDSGSSTATMTSFSHQFFNAWTDGGAFWPVNERPNLVIRVEGSKQEPICDLRAVSDEGNQKLSDLF